jgi:transposase-like protein
VQESNIDRFIVPVPPSRDVMTEILRAGAQKMLADMIQAEVEDWLAERAHVRDEQGRRQVVRNGYLPERKITTGVGPVKVQQPRVRDRRPEAEAEPFSSQILPPYLRKTKSIEELIPWLYLKGISTGDFSEALKALVGPNCPGLSATTVTRLKAVWEEEYQEWSKRSLKGKQYVYLWVDGIHFNIRLEEDRQCILVLMGATADGRKELIAVADGYRESEQSWLGLLLDLKARGLVIDPKLVIGDGALGFWKAVRQVWPNIHEQRCWVHKTANVLDKLPKRLREEAKQKFARHLDGRHQAARPRGLRPIPEDLRSEISQGGGMPGQRPGSIADLLRLPGGALDSLADDQPDRVHLRHRAATHQENQGMRIEKGVPDDGLQTHAICFQEMASAQRLGADARSPPRNVFHRWNQSPRSRRLKTAVHNS